ncbi:GNAT family N-acetyltransferase [Streptomyces sp. NPDC026673]|uniref:GNAT family N-acetyltransferase n=1 Tax=Streptomyces sp. NPDC026673 TaxID=3155724 RepID=UPI00340F1322
MTDFQVTSAGVEDIRRLADWADEEGWNPGSSDGQVFFPTDPAGFLFGRLDGEPVASVSAVRYGADFGFVGLYIARPPFRGKGYGIQVWNAGLERLSGRLVGLDGVVEQQANYRRSGFTAAWRNIRYEGTPSSGVMPGGVALVDARSVRFAELSRYDRRFFPAARDAFLASWIGLPDRTALAAVGDGRLQGLGVLRAARGPSRVGPLYASSEKVALALLMGLSRTSPGAPLAIDVPEPNRPAVRLVEQLGLTPSFEAARMYTGPAPDVDLAGMYGVTSLELG